MSYGAIAAAAAWVGGWQGGAAAALLLPLTGVATLRILERGASLRRLVATGLGYSSLRREIAALRAERRELEALVGATVDAVRPAEMAPLFPREAALGIDDVP